MDKDTPLHLNEPDLTYRLDPESRAQVLPPFDPDALERLLQRAVPEFRVFLRDEILALPGPQEWSHLSRINDPVLQALLDEAWQPFWDPFPLSVLRDESMDGYPGRRLALERRGGEAPE